MISVKKQEKERQRIAAMWEYEKAAKAKGYTWIAGTDKVGRGPLAGPVVAAAVILPENADLPEIKDSIKQQTADADLTKNSTSEELSSYIKTIVFSTESNFDFSFAELYIDIIISFI